MARGEEDKPGMEKKPLVFRQIFEVFRFNVQRPDTKFDPEINEEYLIHDAPFLLPHHL